jgi:hypothetical protein
MVTPKYAQDGSRQSVPVKLWIDTPIEDRLLPAQNPLSVCANDVTSESATAVAAR